MSAGESRIVLIAFGVSIRLAIIAWIIVPLVYVYEDAFLAASIAMIILSVIFVIDLVVYALSSSGFYMNLPAPFRIVYVLIGTISMVVAVYVFTAVYLSYQAHLDNSKQPNNALQQTFDPAALFAVAKSTSASSAAQLGR